MFKQLTGKIAVMPDYGKMQPDETLVLLHVSKAAGSSLRHIMKFYGA